LKQVLKRTLFKLYKITELLTRICVHTNWISMKQSEQEIETVDIVWSLAEYTFMTT